MGAWLNKLWTDEAYFGTLASKIWFVLVSVAGLVASGAIPELTDLLGRPGSWGSKALIIFRIATLVRGDATPAGAKALAAANPMLLEKHLKALGVPTAVATAAADKTAEIPPPKEG